MNVHLFATLFLAVTVAVRVLPTPYGPSSKMPRLRGMPLARQVAVHSIGVKRVVVIRSSTSSEKMRSVSFRVFGSFMKVGKNSVMLGLVIGSGKAARIA